MTKVLMFFGGWDGHQPDETSAHMKKLLEDAGASVTRQGSLDRLDDKAFLSGFDVVVPCWTMGSLPAEAEANLYACVNAGATNIAGWHGGAGDAFRANTMYQFMVGGQFVAHPGNHLEYAVEVADPDHPITRGIESPFTTYSEQYYMHVDPAITPLAHTVTKGVNEKGEGEAWAAGVRMPVVWTKAHGNGRVAYSALGHDMKDFAKPPVDEIAKRCILWAAGAV